MSVVDSARRIGALVLRHLYLFRKSWPRVISLAYYPTVTLIMWAFVTVYLTPSNSMLRDAPGMFIGAVLLWDILFRGQLGVSLSFFEEMYSRNLGNLFVSPLRPWELIVGQLVMSVIRTLIGVGGAALVAWLMFSYSIFTMGFALIAFFVNLIVLGWAIGLAVSGMGCAGGWAPKSSHGRRSSCCRPPRLRSSPSTQTRPGRSWWRTAARAPTCSARTSRSASARFPCSPRSPSA